MPNPNPEKTYTQAEFDAAIAAALGKEATEKKALGSQVTDLQLDLTLIHQGLKPGAKKFLAWQYEQDMSTAQEKVDVATWFSKQSKNEAMVDVIDGFRLPAQPAATQGAAPTQPAETPNVGQAATPAAQPQPAAAAPEQTVTPPPPAPSDTRGSIQLTPEQVAKMDPKEFESMLPTIMQSISNNIN